MYFSSPNCSRTSSNPSSSVSKERFLKEGVRKGEEKGVRGREGGETKILQQPKNLSSPDKYNFSRSYSG